jgi:hypothetical protein
VRFSIEHRGGRALRGEMHGAEFGHDGIVGPGTHLCHHPGRLGR